MRAIHFIAVVITFISVSCKSTETKSTETSSKNTDSKPKRYEAKLDANTIKSINMRENRADNINITKDTAIMIRDSVR